jgi:cytochrome o ubiquinol oxidase subunit 2
MSGKVRDEYLRTSIIVNSGNHHRGPTGDEPSLASQPRSITANRTKLSARRWMYKAVAGGRRTCLPVLLLMLASCSGNTHLTFLNPQGPVANAQRWHFYEVLGIMTVLVAGPIFLLLPFIAWRYRYGSTASRYTPKWEFSWLWEITAWGGPVVIVMLLATLVWRDTHALDPYRRLTSNQPPLRVQVIGYDWKWLFIYPDQGVASIGVLAMPAGRPVAMEITSATVMQSLFIPALGSQIYAMGGMVTQLNLEAAKPGRFMGENTMYNGDGFHQQKFTAVGMSEADFTAWVQKLRNTGIKLDARTLQIISQRTTRSALIDALPGTGVRDGNLYVTGATSALFPAVVMATMDGTALPAQAFGQATAALRAAANAPATMTKQTP